MKKICYCTTIPLTMEAFILKSAAYIHNNTDWDISIICSYDENFAAELPGYIHYYPVSIKRGISFDGLGVIRQMKKIFKRERFDLVQYSTPNASLYASIAAKSAKIPVRLYCQWGMVFAGFSGAKRKVFLREEKLVCDNSTWIEPDSHSNLAFARSLNLYSAKKSSVIWNGSACGIDLNKFDINRKEDYKKEIRSRYGISDDAFVYIFVGRVNRDKGINELLEAYYTLHKQKKTFLFILGGNEFEAGVNSALYNKSVADESVLYTGKVSDVEKYLAASDCYILPSYREGFGMSVIEAQAMGVPVIVTDIPGPTDGMLDGKTGLVVPKQDASALCGAMEKMYADSEMRLRFGRAGHEFVKNNFAQSSFFEYLLQDRKRLLDREDDKIGESGA